MDGSLAGHDVGRFDAKACHLIDRSTELLRSDLQRLPVGAIALRVGNLVQRKAVITLPYVTRLGVAHVWKYASVLIGQTIEPAHYFLLQEFVARPQ